MSHHGEFCAQFLQRGGRLLDIGSGRGKFLCEMAEMGFDAFGVEINRSYIEESYRRAEEKQVRIHIKEAHAEQMPLPFDLFDFVNCAEVTEHVDDPLALCGEIYRVLKPGGFAYVSFHNRFGIFDYHYHLPFINWMPRKWTEPVLVFVGRQKVEDGSTGRQTLLSMHYYTYDGALKLLQKSGFVPFDIRAMKIHGRFPMFVPMFRVAYRLFLRPFYFNTFHFLVQKPIDHSRVVDACRAI